MTLPASGPITLTDVANELGISPAGLTLGDNRVLFLAGKGSALSLSDLYGKSAYTSMTGTGHNSSADFSSDVSGGTAIATPSVTVSGGSGGYTYSWALTSNPNGCVLGANGGASIDVSHSYTKRSNATYSATLQCTITDNTGHVITVTGITATMNITSSL